MRMETFYKLTCLALLTLLVLNLFRVDIGHFAKTALAEPSAVNCVKGQNGIKGGGCSGTVKLKLGSGGVIHTSSTSGLQANTTSAIGGTAALYGKQGLGSGIPNSDVSALLGDAEDSTAIIGLSHNGIGILGASNAANGIRGLSDGDSAVSGISAGWHGVAGRTHSNTAAGVYASGESSAGIALQITQGGIKVEGAGVHTDTPVFIHQVNTAGGGNICAAQNFTTVLDHPLANGRSDAILIVTPNYGNSDAGVVVPTGGYGVAYDVTNSCGKGAGRWVIYNTSSTALPNNMLLNVLVVNP